MICPRSFTGRRASCSPRRGLQLRHLALSITGLVLLTACGEPSANSVARSQDAAAPVDLVYVLDPNALSEQSSVVVVDPATGDIVRDYAAGRDPAMTLSPDGRRLFLASRWSTDGSETDRLDVIDTVTGEVVHSTTLEDRWANTLPAYFPTIEASRDGRWVYVLQAKVLGPDQAQYSVATIDARTGRVLPEQAGTPGCGAASIHSPAAGPRIELLCHAAHEARFVALSDSGAATASERVPLPKQDDDPPGDPNQDLALWRLSGSAASPEARSIYAATQNGYVSIIDAGSRRVSETIDLDLPEDAHVPFNGVTISPAGDRLYLAVGHIGDGFSRLSADEIVAFDTSSWERVAAIAPSQSFESVAVSPSGNYLYAVDTESASVLVLDARTNEETRVISGVGTTPTLAEVSGEG